MGIVRAVCTSPAKGTQKTKVKSAEFIEDFGIKEDAHAGKWHRQISILSYEKIEAFRAQIGKECHHGCEIFQKMGDCIMPREGVFARVIHGGRISCGDEMYILGQGEQ